MGTIFQICWLRWPNQKCNLASQSTQMLSRQKMYKRNEASIVSLDGGIGIRKCCASSGQKRLVGGKRIFHMRYRGLWTSFFTNELNAFRGENGQIGMKREIYLRKYSHLECNLIFGISILLLYDNTLTFTLLFV